MWSSFPTRITHERRPPSEQGCERALPADRADVAVSGLLLGSSSCWRVQLVRQQPARSDGAAMTKKLARKNGGSAFPIEAPHSFSAGMTLRDYFAGAAVTGVLRAYETIYPKPLAKAAYELADAMLKERAK
jgi:hypothetical protein